LLYRDVVFVRMLLMNDDMMLRGGGNQCHYGFERFGALCALATRAARLVVIARG
jgi:hypothetical protein